MAGPIEKEGCSGSLTLSSSNQTAPLLLFLTAMTAYLTEKIVASDCSLHIPTSIISPYLDQLLSDSEEKNILSPRLTSPFNALPHLRALAPSPMPTLMLPTFSLLVH